MSMKKQVKKVNKLVKKHNKITEKYGLPAIPEMAVIGKDKEKKEVIKASKAKVKAPVTTKPSIESKATKLRDISAEQINRHFYVPNFNSGRVEVYLLVKIEESVVPGEIIIKGSVDGGAFSAVISKDDTSTGSQLLFEDHDDAVAAIEIEEAKIKKQFSSKAKILKYLYQEILKPTSVLNVHDEIGSSKLTPLELKILKKKIKQNFKVDVDDVKEPKKESTEAAK